MEKNKSHLTKSSNDRAKGSSKSKGLARGGKIGR